VASVILYKNSIYSYGMRVCCLAAQQFLLSVPNSYEEFLMVRMRSSFVVGLVIVGFSSAYGMNSGSMSASASGVAKDAIAVVQASESKAPVASGVFVEAKLTNFERCQITEHVLRTECQDATSWASAIEEISGEKYFEKTHRNDPPLLHIAAQYNYTWAAYAFVQAMYAAYDSDRARAAVDARDFAGRTAFLCAVSAGNREITAYLLEQGGADRNAQDYRGWSAAHYAVQHGDVAMLEYLRLKGVNLTLKAKTSDELSTKSSAVIEKVPEELLRKSALPLTPLDVAKELLATATAAAKAARKEAHGARGADAREEAWDRVRALETQVRNREAIVKLLA